MSAYTPGPWEVRSDGHALVICAPWSDQVRPETAEGFGDYRGIHIARVTWNPNGSSGLFLANARLIAAAPDLLENLREIVSHAEGAGWDTDGGPDRAALLDSCRAAIEAARGAVER